VKAVAEEVRLLDHLQEVVSTARAHGLRIFFVLHNRWKPGDYVSFDFPSPYHLGSARAEAFAEASWGGTFHDDFQPQPGDVVAREHWGSSGFANTCIEATGRFGMELGYHVTLVKDATAAFSQEGMHAAHAVNGPTYGHAILTTEELLAQLST
jgi:nicotinamidase-related amidase